MKLLRPSPAGLAQKQDGRTTTRQHGAFYAEPPTQARSAFTAELRAVRAGMSSKVTGAAAVHGHTGPCQARLTISPFPLGPAPRHGFVDAAVGPALDEAGLAGQRCPDALNAAARSIEPLNLLFFDYIVF
ncbi:Hypothetical protein RMHFA_05607 (plasmid) [Roseomonas mucosa]|nr:Hypothetical protein RMHFA_05607 [Roseomonas mucosa]